MENLYDACLDDYVRSLLSLRKHPLFDIFTFDILDDIDLEESIRQDMNMYEDGQGTNAIKEGDDDFESPSFNCDDPSCVLPLDCFPGSQLFGIQSSVLDPPLDKNTLEPMWTDVEPKDVNVSANIAHDHCYLMVPPEVKVPECYLTPEASEASEDEIDVTRMDDGAEVFECVVSSPSSISDYGSSSPPNTLSCATSSQCVAATLPVFPQASTSRASNLNLSDRRWSDRRSNSNHQSSSRPVASTSRSGGGHGGSRKTSHGVSQPQISMFSIPRLVPVVTAEEPPAKRRRGKKAAAPKPSTSKTGGPKSSRKTVSSDEKRIRHNDAERKRRAALALLFDDLRNVMPKVEGNKPLPKARALEFGKTCIMRISANMNNTIALIRRFSRVQKLMKSPKIMKRLQRFQQNLAR
ncbi:uncharacterized protein LOC135946660 [Cloeon dipterum]|uniref:uncharacterized protein LOC135946660 n=1 Tax=Cloeon dipterum TaxID=197152 RepID=UPI00322025B8